MYPQKVLQGIPDLKRTVKLCIFYFLIVSQFQPQLISYGLLSKSSIPSGCFQIFSSAHFINLLDLSTQK